jgi:hypothetical protein
MRPDAATKLDSRGWTFRAGLATREDANAVFRLLLEDLGHYGVARKDRDDHGVTVYLEDFSAVFDGARAAIDLAERQVRQTVRWGSLTSPTGGPRPRRCRGSCRGSGRTRHHR